MRHAATGKARSGCVGVGGNEGGRGRQGCRGARMSAVRCRMRPPHICAVQHALPRARPCTCMLHVHARATRRPPATLRRSTDVAIPSGSPCHPACRRSACAPLSLSPPSPLFMPGRFVYQPARRQPPAAAWRRHGGMIAPWPSHDRRRPAGLSAAKAAPRFPLRFNRWPGCGRLGSRSIVWLLFQLAKLVTRVRIPATALGHSPTGGRVASAGCIAAAAAAAAAPCVIPRRRRRRAALPQGPCV